MNIQEKIKKWIKETLKIGEDFVLAHPKDIKNGDYSFFTSAEQANEFGRVLSENKIPEIEKVEVAGGFINFYLSKDFFAESVKEINEKKEECGKTDLLEGKKVLIEHTQPNPFKEFHIGHLMNNAIGESVARIIKANEADAITVGYHGDVGLHVAKAIWAMAQNDHIVEAQELRLFGVSVEKFRKMFGEWYADGSFAYDNNEKAKGEIININKNINNLGQNVLVDNLYKTGRDASLEYFEMIYKKLDSNFDHHFYESEAGEEGKKIVSENVPKIFEESEGAIIFRGENFEPKTHTRVFINSDGIPTYEAKEVGLAKLKKDKYKYDQSITVTANEQDSFFDVVEVAISEVFPELKGKLKHLSHGMLKLPTGKMSSRTGDIITAESLIDQVKKKILEKIKDREFFGEEKENISEMVAIGAIKYSILKQAIGGDIIFDFDKSISFEGDSGPYLQYACVRANSVLEKAPKASIFGKILGNKTERPENFEITELEKYLYRFPEVVERAGKEYAPHYIVTYLTELASIFNSFYAKEKIIDESDPNSPYKIALTQATAYILKSGLHLLGVKVLERM